LFEFLFVALARCGSSWAATAPTGSRGFGGIVAAPVFRTVASAALRLMDVPRDPAETAIPAEDEEDADDLAIAGISQPPEPEEEQPAPVVAVANPNDPKVPNFRGKTKRAVLEESQALGVRVVIAGSGIARSQEPPAGAILQRGERITVHFAP